MRRLATIMFTDIAGYTALMGKDEEKALQVLRKSRDIQKTAIEKYGGKWLKEMGDGTLAQFESALEAILAAMDIQEKAHVDLDARIRIGIHLGDVTIENDDVFGDGVNIASRIQAIADPGGIYVTESVVNAIGGRKEIGIKFFGPVQLKNVSHPVKAYYLTGPGFPVPTSKKIRQLSGSKKNHSRVLYSPFAWMILAAIVSLIFVSRKWWSLSEINEGIRVAVLPVDDLSGSQNREFLTDGIQAALINELGMVSALQVISRTSSSKYRNTKKTIAEIADELKVDLVVEGELLQMDDSVRLHYRLIRAKPVEHQVWSKDYQEATRYVFKIYDDLVREVSKEMNISLNNQEKTRLTRTEMVNPEAYKEYLKSQFHYNNFTANSFRMALQSLDQALKYDSDYMQAYVETAEVWVAMTEMGLVSFEESYPKIKEAESKALSYKVESPLIYRILGQIRGSVEWKWKESIDEFKKAIAINPNDSRVRTFYAYNLSIMNDHEESKRQLDLAIQLDPFNPLIESFYGWTMLYARNYKEAVNHCKKSLSQAPSQWVAQDALRQAYFKLGKLEESLQMTEQMYKDYGLQAVANALDSGYKIGGYSFAASKAAEALIRARDTTNISPESIAEMYAYAGRYDLSIKWLEMAVKSHDPEVHYLAIVPIYDPLRNNPRFQELVRIVGVPHYNRESRS